MPEGEEAGQVPWAAVAELEDANASLRLSLRTVATALRNVSRAIGRKGRDAHAYTNYNGRLIRALSQFLEANVMFHELRRETVALLSESEDPSSQDLSKPILTCDSSNRHAWRNVVAPARSIMDEGLSGADVTTSTQATDFALGAAVFADQEIALLSYREHLRQGMKATVEQLERAKAESLNATGFMRRKNLAVSSTMRSAIASPELCQSSSSSSSEGSDKVFETEPAVVPRTTEVTTSPEESSSVRLIRHMSFNRPSLDPEAQIDGCGRDVATEGESLYAIESSEFNETIRELGPIKDSSGSLLPAVEPVALLAAKIFVVVMTPVYACFRLDRPFHFGLGLANVTVELTCLADVSLRRRHEERKDIKRREKFSTIIARARKVRNFIVEVLRIALVSGTPIWTVHFVVEATFPTGERRSRFRICQVAKCYQIGHLFYSALHSKGKYLTFDPILLRISKLVAFFFFVLHYIGCGYHYVGRVSYKPNSNKVDSWPPSGHEDAEYWVFETSSSDNIENRIDWAFYANYGRRQPVMQQWTRAYYWAAMAVLGNYMKPITLAQTSFNTGAVLLGIFTTATITGSVASLLANADVVAARQRQKRSRIRNYLRLNRVPDQLGQKIHAYYDYLWESKSLPSDDDLFADLSDSLKLKLALSVKRKFILSCPLFRDLDPCSMINLVQCLVPKVCEPGQVLMAEGELGTTMFFVIRGRLAVSIVEAKTKSRIQVAILSTGDHFGNKTASRKFGGCFFSLY